MLIQCYRGDVYVLILIDGLPAYGVGADMPETLRIE